MSAFSPSAGLRLLQPELTQALSHQRSAFSQATSVAPCSEMLRRPAGAGADRRQLIADSPGAGLRDAPAQPAAALGIELVS